MCLGALPGIKSTWFGTVGKYSLSSGNLMSSGRFRLWEYRRGFSMHRSSASRVYNKLYPEELFGVRSNDSAWELSPCSRTDKGGLSLIRHDWFVTLPHLEVALLRQQEVSHEVFKHLPISFGVGVLAQLAGVSLFFNGTVVAVASLEIYCRQT